MDPITSLNDLYAFTDTTVEMLQEVLQRKPYKWEEANYSDSRFHLFPLNNGDEEYNDTVQLFSSLSVSEIKRVQNPFIYGRFLLRKEYLIKVNGHVDEIVMFHPVVAEDINIVCEYNCDYRRYTRRTHYSERVPRFYKTAGMAADALSSDSEKAIVVVAYLGTVSSMTYSTPSWDTEYYPKYIVYLN